MQNLKDKTLFITGASRGIGKAIALKAAADGANIIIASKTVEPHPKLEGTIHTAAAEIEAAGGKALPIQTDIRDEQQIQNAIEKGSQHFGGIDILINNASAISLTGTLETTSKRYDLMDQVNARGTFLCSKHCLPYLKQSKHPHILVLAPPLTMQAKWFTNHMAYTISKYGMSMCVLGLSSEFADAGIAVNALWPKTLIFTSAMQLFGDALQIAKNCRKPEIVADAAYQILIQDPRSYTGHFFIDEDVLKEAGVTDFSSYAIDPSSPLIPDFFL